MERPVIRPAAHAFVAVVFTGKREATHPAMLVVPTIGNDPFVRGNRLAERD